MSPRSTPPSGRLVVDRVVIHGVPAVGLDPVGLMAGLGTSMPALLARAAVDASASRRHARVASVEVAWRPASGVDAVAQAVADGVKASFGTVSHE